MRIAYLDCFAGISGDMFLGALLDAGVPASVLSNAVSALQLGASLRIEKLDRSGISALKVHVLEGEQLAESAGLPHAHDHAHAQEHSHAHDHAHSHDHEHEDSPEQGRSHNHAPGQPRTHEHAHVHGRSLTQIRALIQASSLGLSIQDFAVRTFELLGHSEAKIHNVPIERIHFHEVGAVDAIVDIVAASAGIEYLNQQGKLTWFCSPINVGGGMVECAHGNFPVPAPATADLLRDTPTYSAHVQKELVTPTGAALLRALSPTFGGQPPMRVQSIGYGAGTRNPERFPNVLRLSLGEAEGAASLRSADAHQQADNNTGDTVMVLETALDDTTPQLLAYLVERVLEAGALDAMLTPVVMKKGRPATLVTVLCDTARTAAMEDLLLRETTTLGIRKHTEQRCCLDRHQTSVSTDFGDIRIKIGTRHGEIWNAMPEFEDCRTAALKHDAPLKQVMQAAIAAYAFSPAL